MSWRAIDWAWERDVDSSPERLVLLMFANHADKHTGYTWPSVDLIASVCRLDRKTVRRAIAGLLVRHSIRPTKKRFGPTGQVRVYRMPKSTYERLPKTAGFKNIETVHIEARKSPISGRERDPNREPGTVNQERLGEKGALGNSLAEGDNDVSHSQEKKLLSFSPKPAALPEWVEKIQQMPEFAKRHVAEEARKIKADAATRDRPFNKQYVVNCLRKYPPKGAKRKKPRIKQECKTPDVTPTSAEDRAKLNAKFKKEVEALRQKFAFK
jgi:hypothetical protein